MSDVSSTSPSRARLTQALRGAPSAPTWSAIAAAFEQVITCEDEATLELAFEEAYDALATWPKNRRGTMPEPALKAWLQGDLRYTALAELCGLNESKLQPEPKRTQRSCTFYRVRHLWDQWEEQEQGPQLRLKTYCTSSYERMCAYVRLYMTQHLELGQGRWASHLFSRERSRNWLAQGPDSIEVVIHGVVTRHLGMSAQVTVERGAERVALSSPLPSDGARAEGRRVKPLSALLSKSAGELPSKVTLTRTEAQGPLQTQEVSLHELGRHPWWASIYEGDASSTPMTICCEAMLASVPKLRARQALPKDVHQEERAKGLYREPWWW